MIARALIEGLLYSVVLGIYITVSQLFNARLWLTDYPKAIQEKVPSQSKKEKSLKIIIGIPFLLFMLGYPVYSTVLLKEALTGEYMFLKGFLNTFIISFSFVIFDLVILDWLIFCRINPGFLVIPGSEGMNEYKDYRFHLRGLVVGGLLCVLLSLITTVVL